VVRLGAEPALGIVRSTAESIVDAVMTADGSVVVLEQQADLYTFDVRCVTPDGTTIWKHSYRAKPGSHDGVRYDSRLLADSHGRVFVSTRGSLVQVDGSGSTVVARWSGMPAVLCPDGRIGYLRIEPSRARYWVVLDVDTSADTTIELGPATREEVLHDAIGVDAVGRVYWRGHGKLARMLPDGDIDWLVTLRWIAVSERYGATILTFTNDHMVRFDNRGRESIDLSTCDLDSSMGRLAGRRNDGGYLLYKTLQGTYGRLSHVDRYGRLIRTEPAPDDVWLTMDTAQLPDFSSVTPDGAVLVAVRSKSWVHVVRLTPDDTT
jgi:outer membrane protein assembly factor BamB